MSQVVVIAELEFDAAHLPQWLECAAPFVAATREEPGVLEYLVTVVPGSDTKVLMTEVYADEEAVDAHAASQHIADFRVRASAFPPIGKSVSWYSATPMGPRH